MNIIKTLDNIGQALELNPQGGFRFFSAVDNGKGRIDKYPPDMAAWTNLEGLALTVAEAKGVVSTIKAMIEGLTVLPEIITYGALTGLELSYLDLKNAQAAFPDLYFSRIDGEITAIITEGVKVTAIR